jgi:hypothetical protein
MALSQDGLILATFFLNTFEDGFRKKKRGVSLFQKNGKIRGRPRIPWFGDLPIEISKKPGTLLSFRPFPHRRTSRQRQGPFLFAIGLSSASHGILRYGKPWPLIGVLGVVEKPNFETSKVSRIRGSHLIRCVIGTTLSLVHNALQCATEPRTRSQLQGRPSW